ncbi:hypothetical protein B0H14DRAFT_3071998 [Mycena olivaceomarginata]|nr:hypothetical protein B0H14DRAFT_3071998 [Mycena olivaceomarginata]
MLHDPYTTSALRPPLRCPTALCCPTALRRPPYTRSASTRSTFLRQRLHRPTPCLHPVLVCRPTYAPTLMPAFALRSAHYAVLPPSSIARLSPRRPCRPLRALFRTAALPLSVQPNSRSMSSRARLYTPAATLVYLLAASIAPPPPPSLPSPPPPRPHSPPLHSSTPPPCPPPPLPTPYSTHSRRRAHSHRPRLTPRPFAVVPIHAAHDPHRVQRRTFRHPRCRRDHPCGRCRPHPRRR